MESLHAHLESFKTLALLWQIATLQEEDTESEFFEVSNVLLSISPELEPGLEYNGKHESGIYDCIIWIDRALKKLVRRKIFPEIEENIGMFAFAVYHRSKSHQETF